MANKLLLNKAGTKLLLRNTANKLAISDDDTTNCCCQLAIIIANINNAIDDDFQVLLNGNVLGTINNNSNTCTGRIFAVDSAITGTNFPSAVGCSGAHNFEATVAFAPALLVNGTNTVRIESIVNHFNGNFGEIRVLGAVKSGTLYLTNKTYFLGTYSHPQGVYPGSPLSFTQFTFVYP